MTNHTSGNDKFFCNKCTRWFKRGDSLTSCLVIHGEGDCCHISDTEVTTAAYPEVADSTDVQKNATPEPTLQEQLVNIINTFIIDNDLADVDWCLEHKDGLHAGLEVGQKNPIILTLTQFIEKAERKARIDELKRVLEMEWDSGHGYFIRLLSVKDRIKELEESE